MPAPSQSPAPKTPDQDSPNQESPEQESPEQESPEQESPEQAVSALPSAMLLAATGGILDAVVYLNHGHVFANAMTGNVVLLGISLVSGDWSDILPHLVPIFAFLAGVLASHLLRALPTHPGALAALSLEALVLAGVTLLPASFPHSGFVAIVAFVSAYQVATFRRVGAFTYNSTFTTGNLRDTMEGLYSLIAEADPALRLKGRQKFRSLGSICICFLMGAALGGWAAPRFGDYALFLTEPALLAVLLLVWIRHRS